MAERGGAMMDFRTFRQSIRSKELQAVADHWQEARRGRLMPGWRDLRPAAMRKQLPIIWSYAYDPATGDFTGRLAGDKITQIFEKNFKGLSIAQAHPPEAVGWVRDLFKRVVTEPALYHYEGQVFRQLNRHGAGERIILPLSSDGAMADGLLGATEYGLRPGVAVVVVPPATDAEQWFPIKG